MKQAARGSVKGLEFTLSTLQRMPQRRYLTRWGGGGEEELRGEGPGEEAVCSVLCSQCRIHWLRPSPI
jgi:hypothetical protein